MKKKYGLVWEKHTEKVDEMLEHNIPVFCEDKAKKIVANKDKEYNFLLEGDNLHSLKLLEKTHKGKIDVIYIDPPYNTGNKDFIYNDSFVEKTDGYSHSKWLSFMSERLEIARELLSDDSVIFISIDDNEQAQYGVMDMEVNTHIHGIDRQHCVNAIKKHIGLSYDKTHQILKTLFLKGFGNKRYKILNLNLREFYAFYY